MSLIRIGQVVVNFANVTTVTRVEGSVNLVVRFVNGEEKTFEGDEALGLQAYIDKSVKTAVKPLEDFVVSQD